MPGVPRRPPRGAHLDDSEEADEIAAGAPHHALAAMAPQLQQQEVGDAAAILMDIYMSCIAEPSEESP
ncbi:g7672 [Coccomyxa elongata]